MPPAHKASDSLQDNCISVSRLRELLRALGGDTAPLASSTPRFGLNTLAEWKENLGKEVEDGIDKQAPRLATENKGKGSRSMGVNYAFDVKIVLWYKVGEILKELIWKVREDKNWTLGDLFVQFIGVSLFVHVSDTGHLLIACIPSRTPSQNLRKRSSLKTTGI